MPGMPGNVNAAKDKPWRDAIRRALLADDGKRLRAIADRLVAKAEEGDIAAIKELGDRIDGKPEQRTTIAGDAENPLLVAEAAALLANIRK